VKGLARKNTRVKYESPTTYKSKIMTIVKVLLKKVKCQGQTSEDLGGFSDIRTLPV
jgi:hypothetical protein